MSVIRAMATGFGRVLASPLILLCLWGLGFVAALPGAWMMYESLREGIGASRVHESLRDGFDVEWHGEFADGAGGLASTFRPTVTGAGAFYDNLEGWVEGSIFRGLPLLVGVGVAYALVWALFLGGALDRYAHRDERPSFRRYISGCGRYFPRFVRLSLLSAALYASIYFAAKELFGIMEESTRDVTVEGTIFLYSVSIWGGAALLLTLVHMVFGYAKIATVVDDRRSMLLAALRGLTFVVMHPGKALGLYYGFVVLSGLLLAVYAGLAPGIGQSTYESVGWAFAIGQLFLVARLFMRLSLLAGQTALYQAGSVRPARSTPVLSPLPATPDESLRTV